MLRGLDAIFRVTNTGREKHNFSAFGKTTPALKPGANAHFKVVLITRGKYSYKSTLDSGKRGFRGFFVVY
jgi:hypothetical protein